MYNTMKPENIVRITNGPNHHFFGYYDKTPWNQSSQYLLGMQVRFTDRPPTATDKATIGLIDINDQYRWHALDETTAWNWQQGAMLQWLPEPGKILYNVYINNQLSSCIFDIHSGEKTLLPLPVYTITHCGQYGLSINFPRLHNLRPGYGYAVSYDPWQEDNYPNEDGIYWMDIKNKRYNLILSIDQVARYNYNETMNSGKHCLYHLQVNTTDSRFAFLHRWPRWQKDHWWWWSRMFTAQINGEDLYCLAEYDMISHFDWKDDKQILTWARPFNQQDHYYLLTDQSQERSIIGDSLLDVDGHCSFSPNRKWILTDTYPDKHKYRTLILYHIETNRRVDIGRFFVTGPLDGELRCDLHPRWSPNGQQICIDSVHEGTRQMYIIDISNLV